MGLAVKKIVLLCACVALAGCVSANPGSEAVRIVKDREDVAGCRFIEQVRGNQNMIGGIVLAGAAYEDSLRIMKNKTVATGGNRLLLVDIQSGLGGANGIGDAYRC